MAAPAYTTIAATVPLSTTAKTAAAIVMGSQDTATLTEVAVSCDGTSGNLIIEIVYGTNATAGTSTGGTITQVRGITRSSAVTTQVNYSAEPTVLSAVKRYRLPLPSGPLVIQQPLGRELEGQTGSASGRVIGVRLTASTGTPNADVTLEWED